MNKLRFSYEKHTQIGAHALIVQLVSKRISARQNSRLTFSQADNHNDSQSNMNTFINRHELISALNSLDSGKAVDEAVQLWELLATKLIAIIGESGLNALYDRTITLSKILFPFLDDISLQNRPNQRFEALRECLSKQTPELASQANTQLLVNFTDILATLIGEELTLQILRSAWCNEANSLWMPKKND